MARWVGQGRNGYRAALTLLEQLGMGGARRVAEAWSGRGWAMRPLTSPQAKPRSHPTVAEVVEESYHGLVLTLSRSCARTRNGPKASLPQSSGFFCSLGKRDLLAAFKGEPHKRQKQHKF
jgi:hypothetical protein